MEGIGGENFAPGQIFSSDLGQMPIVPGAAAHSSSIVGMTPNSETSQNADAVRKESALATLTYKALHSGHTPEKALAQIANAIHQEFSGVDAAVFFAGGSKATRPLPGTPVYCREKKSKSTARWSKALRQIAGDSIAQRRFASRVIKSGDKTLMVVANPVVINQEVVGVFGLVGDSSASRELAQTINVVSGAVSQWWKTESQKPRLEDADSDMSASSLVSGNVADLDRTLAGPTSVSSESITHDTVANNTFLNELMTKPCFESSTHSVAHHLSSEFGFEKVFVGRGERGGGSRLLAISNTAKFSPKSPLTTAVEEVLSEAVIRDEVAIANIRKGGEAVTGGSRELSRLCNQPIIVSGPLRGASGAWGAWVGVGTSLPDANVAARIEAQPSPLALVCSSLIERVVVA